MALTLDQLVVKLEADITDFKKGMKEAGDVSKSGTDKITGSFDGAGDSIKSFIGGIGAMQAAVAAVAAGAMVALVKNTFDAADNLAALSDKTGVSTKFMQEMQFAASQLNVEQDTLNSSLAIFTRTIGQASLGQEGAAKGFEHLGIKINDTNGKVKSSEVLFAEVTKAFEGVTDSSQRAAIAQELFGRGGVGMVNILAEGSKGLQEMRDRANELGLVIDEKLLRAADETNDKMSTLHQVLSAQVSKAILELAPVIQVVVDKMIDAAKFTGELTAAMIWFWKNSTGTDEGTARITRLTGELKSLEDQYDRIKINPKAVGMMKEATEQQRAHADSIYDQIVATEAELASFEKAEEKKTEVKTTSSALDKQIRDDRAAKQLEMDEAEVSALMTKIEIMSQLTDADYFDQIEKDQKTVDAKIANMNRLGAFSLKYRLGQQKEETAAAAESAKTDKQLAADRMSTLNFISSLQNSKSKELAAVGKAAAIAQSTVNTYQAANLALASFPPPFGFIMAAAVTAAGLANVASIAGVGFEQGADRIPGRMPGDRTPIMVEGGERIIKRDTNDLLEAALLSGRGLGGGPVEVRLTMSQDMIPWIEAQLIERGRLSISAEAA